MSSPSQSSFIPLQDLVPGYPKLSGEMGLLPEIAIFRRFGALNSQNLLYLQAELVFMERKLRKVEAENIKDYRKSRYAVDWYWLNESQFEDDDPEQIELVQEISKKLKHYSEHSFCVP
jgi:hypothetical protein